jgi:4-alpha-glucanotransferase
VDFLHEAGQCLWQILPLNPTDLQFGNSPYSSISAFAMNPLLVNPKLLADRGLLNKNVAHVPGETDEGSIDYRAVSDLKGRLFFKAFTQFKTMPAEQKGFEDFCSNNRHWLDDYALFSAIRRDQGCTPWRHWPLPLRARHPGGLERARNRLHDSICYEKFLQYLCTQQWLALKSYANDRGVSIIGDMPLYVNLESADVWAAPHLFKLDEEMNPLSVSGVPPDFFSETGQLWNNPIFDWNRLKEQDYSWWVERITRNLGLYDSIRIDHFRGLAGYWEVPFDAETAASGTWKNGPGEAFLQIMADHFPALPFIAEDLGVITDDVKTLRDRFGLPGMRVFQFGFGENGADLHRPHQYVHHCVAYSGTHDNDTLLGWLYGGTIDKRGRRVARKRRKQVAGYLRTGMCIRQRLRYSVLNSILQSRAGWVIIPMQDVLGLGSEARMNTPGTASGNWEWRLEKDALNERTAYELKSLTKDSGRSDKS